EHAGHVDDSPPALLEHGANYLLRAQVGRGEIGVDDGVPIGPFHAHNQLVACDSRVVHQDVDLAKLRDDCLDGSFDLFLIGDVEHECARLTTSASDFSDYFSQFFLVACDGGDGRARLGQFHCASVTDALGGSSYQRHAS